MCAVDKTRESNMAMSVRKRPPLPGAQEEKKSSAKRPAVNLGHMHKLTHKTKTFASIYIHTHTQTCLWPPSNPKEEGSIATSTDTHGNSNRQLSSASSTSIHTYTNKTKRTRMESLKNSLDKALPPSALLKTCKRCKEQYDPTRNSPPGGCRYHLLSFAGETKQRSVLYVD